MSNEIARRDKQGVIDDILGGIPSETLTDELDGRWTLEMPNLRYNKIKTQQNHKIGYEMVLHPAQGTANGRLLIYCHGHEGNRWDTDLGISEAERDITIIRAAFPNYDILQSWGFAYSEATGPSTTKYRNRPIAYGSLAGHNSMIAIRSQMMLVNTVHFFAAVSTFSGSYSKIFMTGMSGGGWASLIMGMLDSRIDGVFPMAGWQPDWVWESSTPVAGPGDFEQSYGPHIARTSRVGMAALATNWHHSFWNTNDNVQPLSQVNAALSETIIQEVNPNYYATAEVGDPTHYIMTEFLDQILIDMDAL